MSIRFLTNIVKSTLVLTVALATFLPIVNVSRAQDYTTEKEFTTKLINQLGSSSVPASKVLGQNVKVPFFPRGFTYPIPELDNCDSKEACKQYCEMGVNLEMCAMISFRMGMMDQTQLSKTLAFANYLNSDYLANCNSISECVRLCDDQSVQSECELLAMNLSSGTQVLGVSEELAYTLPSDSILNYCDSYADCTVPKNSGTNPNEILASLFDRDTSGRVLNVSIEDLQNGGGTTDGGGVLNSPEPYQPTNYLSCVVNSQYGGTNTELIAPEQFDQFSQDIDRCGTEHSPTQGQVDSFSSGGKQKVNTDTNAMVACFLGLTSGRDIASCINQ